MPGLAWSPVSWQLTLGMRRNWKRKCVLDKDGNMSSRGWNHHITGCHLMVSSGPRPHNPLNCSPHIHHDNWKGLRPLEACFLLQLTSSPNRDVKWSRLPRFFSAALFMNVDITSAITSRGEQSVSPHSWEVITKFCY